MESIDPPAPRHLAVLSEHLEDLYARKQLGYEEENARNEVVVQLQDSISKNPLLAGML